MITLYTFATANGRKISIALEELGFDYAVETIDLNAGEQFAPAFLQISPNNKIPAIIDHAAPDGPMPLFESGAILIYLAEKAGRLLPPSGPDRYHVLEWLQWEVGGFGPMLSQLLAFGIFLPTRNDHAIRRFQKEAERLLTVMEMRLAKQPYLGGEHYSIADIAALPRVVAIRETLSGYLADALSSKPALLDWTTRLLDRPAVQRGMAVPGL